MVDKTNVSKVQYIKLRGEHMMNDYDLDYQEPIYSPGETLGRLEVELSSKMEHALGYVRFYLEIINSAAQERDIEYFNSDLFGYHAQLVGLDPKTILKQINERQLIKKKPNKYYKTMNREQVRGELQHKIDSKGATFVDLAKEYGVCYLTIRRLLDPSYKALKKKWIDSEKIKQEYQAGISAKKIAKTLGISQTAVYARLKAINKHQNRLDRVIK